MTLIRFPICSFLGLGIGLALAVPCFKVWQHLGHPIEYFYLPTYAKTAIPQMPSLSGKPRPPEIFHVFVYEGRLLLPTTLISQRGTVSYRPYISGRKGFHETLRQYVYSGSLLHTLRWPLGVSGILLLGCLMTGSTMDARRKSNAKKGIQKRGPVLVSRWRFNRITKGDGFAIALENFRNPFELCLGARGRCIRIKRKHENNHIACLGDPGAGKTSLFMQILDQVERRA